MTLRDVDLVQVLLLITLVTSGGQNASYVKTLVPLKEYTHSWGERMKCEFWIGSGNPNYYNFPTKHVDLPYDSWGWH